MNSVIAAGYMINIQNMLLFYTLIMNYHKDKLRKQSHYSCIKKNKIPWNKHNQGGQRPVLRKL